MDFITAIGAAREGGEIARRDWNEQGLHLFRAANSPEQSYLEVHTAVGPPVPWLGSPDDYIADDWIVTAPPALADTYAGR